jgi:hypothetical protein
LQGDPSAGFQWEQYINKILIEELGFKNTTHERNLYRGTVSGSDVIVCRQVDDFACASADGAVAAALIAMIKEPVTTESKGTGIFVVKKGHHLPYNGIDLYQTCDYVKVACDTYIRRLLQTQDWLAASSDKEESDASPITDDAAKMLYELRGPMEDTDEASSLREKIGFSY